MVDHPSYLQESIDSHPSQSAPSGQPTLPGGVDSVGDTTEVSAEFIKTQEDNPFLSLQDRTKLGQSMLPLYMDDRPSFVVYSLDVAGVVDLTRPRALFDQLVVNSVVEMERERVQYMMSSVDEKIYSFGREHRLFSISSNILDTQLTRPILPNPRKGPGFATVFPTLETVGWTGAGFRDWKRFYEHFARLSVCARKRFLVRFYYQGRNLFGAISQMTLDHNANTPHTFGVNLVMYVTWVDVE